MLLRIILPLQLDLADPFLNRRNPERDFLLFLLQLFEGNDFVAQLREGGGLGGAFAAEIDLALLQQPLFMPQRHARPLPPDL